MKILISDIFFRKTFDIISILKKKKNNMRWDLILGVPKKVQKNFINLFLMYGINDYVVLRTDDKNDFFEDIDSISKKYSTEEIVYLPVEENTTSFFLDYIEKNGTQNFKFLLPSKETFDLFRNKLELNKYCLTNSFPAPKLYNLDSLQFPVLLKPVHGSGSRGIIRIYNHKEFTEDIKLKILNEPYVAQELIPNGKDVQGAFFLCHDGQVIGAYTHQRIRTFPPSGGVTILSKYTNNTRLIAESSKLLQSVKWNGFVMLEYLYDKKCDKYKVIEANPRLWGSIMLSEFSGENFLDNYIRLCVDMPLLPINVNENVYIRWFVPDFISFIKGRLKIKDFWKIKNTCLINWTYAQKLRAIYYLLYSTLQPRNIKKLFIRK